MTSVWPALWPPWKRTTTSARSESQSTILPLPSSPHWAPITATFAIEPDPSVHGVDSIALETVSASEPARFGGGIGNFIEPCHGHPAFSAQALGDRGIASGGEVDPPRWRLRRQRAQYRVGVERQARRRLALAIPRAIATAAPELAAHAARIKTEADPGVVFQSAVLDGIDRDGDARQGGAEAVGRVHEPRPLFRCRGRQLERLQGAQRRGGDTRACQELAQQRRGAPADRRHRRCVLVVEGGAQAILLLGAEA